MAQCTLYRKLEISIIGFSSLLLFLLLVAISIMCFLLRRCSAKSANWNICVFVRFDICVCTFLCICGATHRWATMAGRPASVSVATGPSAAEEDFTASNVSLTFGLRVRSLIFGLPASCRLGFTDFHLQTLLRRIAAVWKGGSAILRDSFGQHLTTFLTASVK